MKTFLFLVLSSILLSGCQVKEEHNISEKPKEPVKKKSTVDSSGIVSNLSETEFEGIYSLNSNENIFRVCSNPDTVYWVKDGTGKLKELYEKFHSSKNYYGAVVAKLKGEIVPTEIQKHKEKYPRTIVVNEVIDVQKKNFRNTCMKYDFWALGNEPNWSLQISGSEKLIELIDYSNDKTYNFFYEEPKNENGIIIYAAHNKIQRISIDIFVKKEECSDTMSDEKYDYSVEVKLSSGIILKGCGIKGK